MMGFSLESRLVLLLLLHAVLCLHRHNPVAASALAAPSFIPESDPAPEGKLPLSMAIKTGAVSSVNRRGGGGHGGGGRGGSGRGRGGEEGGGRRGGAGTMIPLYAGGAAGAGARSHDNGVALNRGKPNPIHNLGLAVMLALPLLFNNFA
ncbi:unnamed protein product [Linum tenue]|uniref:Glycine-rich protein n=1 Tax=Linum tenue TaxID=586396 RepID=A0AAV0IMQ5_9ROSI|nr:unnamed protein product [Linum tenue]